MAANNPPSPANQAQSPPSTVPIPDPSIPTWPRRVSKACCSCRRDKIRCDGARPCAGCLKKGFPPEKCIDGCLPCRRARARCEGGMPCTRCQTMQLACVDDATATPMKPDPALKASMRGSRGRTIERAKLACLACRRDNKKCDDQRPCTRCQARSEECIHVQRGPKVVKLRCKACRRENRKCEDHRPCKFCTETNEPCSDVPRKGRGHGTRVKTACMNCRRDKIQCGTERPCKGCVRRGYDCVDRTCTCFQKGTGQDCPVCRVRKAKGDSSRSPGTEGDDEDDGEPFRIPEKYIIN
ncbi:hypothetical protein BD410DRAFT_715691 [Rickenella mellea]|uniref:Transcription activator of gluconeogenesis ERT1 n=1 Tax=Rickenella mellea TaxID=50990 RepID=A0A4Y7QIL9_9AGAM|nr:hypothetical protein BD410DRAFT_715691 [Rickenella mellea]